MTNHTLKDRWSNEHTAAFLDLKAALTSEPVLRGPKWDGTPFIITTDGCQDAFGAVLTQKFDHVLPSGKLCNAFIQLDSLPKGCLKQKRSINCSY